jgi:hypothetical protein
MSMLERGLYSVVIVALLAAVFFLHQRNAELREGPPALAAKEASE